MDRVQEVWKCRTKHETVVLCLCVQRVAQCQLTLFLLTLLLGSMRPYKIQLT